MYLNVYRIIIIYDNTNEEAVLKVNCNIIR